MSDIIIKKINKLSSLTQSSFAKSIKKESFENLKLMKDYCDDLYYNYNNSKKSILTDKQYDLIVEYLEKDADFKHTVGAKIREDDNRVKLPYWLGSLDKIKDDNPEAIERWITKYKTNNYIVEDKLDGISCLLTSDNLGNIKLYTRGDGKIGSDISYLCQYFKKIPEKIAEIAIRGELIINKQVFEEKYTKEFSNARNMVSGAVSGKTFSDVLNDIEFIAYEIIGEKLTPIEQLKKLKDIGFEVVNSRQYNIIDHAILLSDLISNKSSSKYEIDGIIIQPDLIYERNISGNPKYAFAFKMMHDDDVIETTVKDVEWNPSKWGVLKPRINIETVYLNGVNINYTTGFNAKFILENKINQGSIIKITRSGDVIPFIVEVVTQSTEPKLPNIKYIWNESKVDILIDQTIEAESVNTMNIKMITSIFEKLGVKYVSEKTVEKLYHAGFDTFTKILQMNKEDFLKLDGVENKLANKLYENIRKGSTNVPLYQLIGASGTLGYGMGIKKMKSLFQGFPNILRVYENEYYEKEGFDNSELVEKIVEIEGFSSKTALQVVNNLDKVLIFLSEVLPYITIEKNGNENENENENELEDNNNEIVIKNIKETSPKIVKLLENMKICFTGFRDKDLEKVIDINGGKVTTSVSKNTKILIVKSIDDVSTKINDAKKLGLEILEKEEFLSKYIS